jgi:hypothetical protein
MDRTEYIQMRTFNIKMYPQYNQNPASIPYVVDLSPCSSHSYISNGGNPGALTMDKSLANTNWVNINVYPTYHNVFTQSYTSYCPILRYDLLA